jgi:TPR repeat protein
VPQDLAQAWKYFKLSADQNLDLGQFYCGLCLYEGRGVSQDWKLAWKYFKLSADQNMAVAQAYCGVCHFQGRGIEKSDTLAAEYFKRSADQNHPNAQFYFGFCLYAGRGVAVDHVEAAKYGKLSADQGCVDGLCLYGCCLFAGRGVRLDYVRAADYFRRSAHQNCRAAAYRYAKLIEAMYPGNAHLPEAMAYYEQAAGSGRPLDLISVGIACEFGRGVSKDLERAVKCYASGAEAQDSEAQAHLGFCLRYGIGCEADWLKSTEWYHKSADHGDVDGRLGYAFSLQFGIGCDTDLEEAAKYYALSVSKSHSPLSHHSYRCLRAVGKAELPRTPLTRSEDSVTWAAHDHPHLACSGLAAYIDPCPTVPGGRLIGRGGYSEVFSVKSQETGERTAVKRFLPEFYDSTKLIREIEILSHLNHPCVLRMLGWTPPIGKNPAEIRVVQAENGSLKDVLEKAQYGGRYPFWNPTGKAVLICGIALGMRYIHSKELIHRDLKPANILVNNRGEAIISDFGLSCPEIADYTLTPDCPFVSYAAPELFAEGIAPTQKVDVYAFGLLLYEIITGSAVFPPSLYPFPIMDRITKGVLPAVPDECGPVMQDLIPRCWSMDPDMRPTFDEIIQAFKAVAFFIIPRADAKKLYEYVIRVEMWEREDNQ